MSRAYSSAARAEFNALSGDAALILLEIHHSALSVPIRVVNNTEDIISNGETYIAMGFRVTLPDDFEAKIPRATLSVDNIGRELTQWIETAGGAEGATVRIMQVMPAALNVIEWEITLELSNITIVTWQVSGDLGFEDLMGKSAVPMVYNKHTAPGIF